MELKQVTLKSKKTGKEFTAYRFEVGDFISPIFFPSKIELDYLRNYFSNLGDE